MSSHVSELLQLDTNSESDDTSELDETYTTKQYRTEHDFSESLIQLEGQQKSQRRTIDWTSCLVHRQTKCGALECWTDVSWGRFCSAALERQDEIYELLKEYIDGTKPLTVPLKELVKHHNCYASYVLPKAVTLAKESRLKDNTCTNTLIPSTSVERPRSSDSSDVKTRSHAEKTNIGKCIICQHDKRHPTKRWRLEETHPLTQTKSGQKLVEAATQRGDDRLLRDIGGGARGGKDLIAGDILVHDTCRRNYVGQQSLRYVTSDQVSDCSGFTKAFKQIASEIQTRVIDGHEVMHLSDIRDQMIDILREYYAVNSPSYRNQTLKTRIQQEFGDKINFWYPNRWRQASELVFSNEIPTGMILEAGISATRALQGEEVDAIEMETAPDTMTDQVRAVYHTAMAIRSSLHEIEDLSWPPRPQDINETNINIPTALYNLLTWVIYGDSENLQQISLDEKVIVPPDTHVKIQSIGQDILYCCRNGSVRTPKHVSLAVAAHHITGGTELVTLMNHFGHCVSKSKLQEIETAVAEQHLVDKGQPILPGNIIPNVPVVFGWDNIDYREETVSGKGTTHNTNGIMVQPAVSTCEPPNPNIQTKSSRRKSLKPEDDELYNYKVSKRPEPPRYENATHKLTNLHPVLSQPSRDTDFIWFLARLSPTLLTSIDDETTLHQTTPGWVGFNAALRKDESFPLPHRIGYCSAILAPPTQMDVIYTFLRRSVDMVDINNDTEPGTGNSSVHVEVDLGIWMKAMEVKFGMKDDQRINRIVLRQGLLHLGMAFLSIPAKRYGSAGLRDIFIEADVIATGSVNKVFEGQHWNCGVRAHKIGAEAFSRLRWKGFLCWLTDVGKDVDTSKLIEEVIEFRENISQERLLVLQASEIFQQTQSLYVDYIESLTGQQRFWSDYIEIILILLRFIRSARESDWNLHIECLLEMIVWFWAYDRVNYERYLPVYLLMMHNLAVDHPYAHEDLTSGQLFTVQRSKDNPFGRIPVDQTVESTINRDSKTRGGIIGISRNVAASFKWSLLLADRADYTKQCRLLSGQDSSDARKVRILEDEKHVLRVMETVCDWRNPFEGDDILCHIATGTVATAEVACDLLEAHARGLTAMKAFVHDRLESDDQVNFYSPIHKLKLKTFDSMTGSKVKSSSAKETLKSSRDLFARLFLLGQVRHIDHVELMTYPLGSLPLAITTSNGNMAKTVKSSLLKKLEELVDPPGEVPTENVAYIHDAMAILHTLNPSDTMTYSDLAVVVVKVITKNTPTDCRIDLVADTYMEVSIKNTEREARGLDQTRPHLTTISSGSQRIDRQFRNILRSSKFKESLIAFLVKEWQTDTYVGYIGRRTVYVTSGEECYTLSVDGGKIRYTVAEHLTSNHEEADCRIMLHVIDAEKSGNTTVIIQSPDTDVAVLGIAHSGTGAIEARLLFLTGTQHRKRYADLTSISEKLGSDVSNGLIGVHAFTGCDSVSSFVGHGKTAALKLLTTNDRFCNAMQQLGCSFDVTDNLIDSCETGVCALYGYPNETSVNHVRHIMFGSRTTDPSRLPPCANVLSQHTKRSNYQAAIWRNSLHPKVIIPSPHNHGWELQNQELTIKWMTNQPAPQALLKMVNCGCRKTCGQGSRCSCQQNRLSCTPMCKCDSTSCLNRHLVDNVSDSEESDIE